eukprot:318184-Chlamydomonas_euryale.AAC.1
MGGVTAMAAGAVPFDESATGVGTVAVVHVLFEEGKAARTKAGGIGSVRRMEGGEDTGGETIQLMNTA